MEYEDNNIGCATNINDQKSSYNRNISKILQYVDSDMTNTLYTNSVFIPQEIDFKLLDLYTILRNGEYYSLCVEEASLRSGMSLIELYNLDNKLHSPNALKFKRLTDDSINVFTWGGKTYIGLESRRIDYERDKANNCNWVEDAIKSGYYNK